MRYLNLVKSIQVAVALFILFFAPQIRAGIDSYAAWSMVDEGGVNVYYSSLAETGHWSTPRKITTMGTNVTPTIVADSNDRVWIAWVEFTKSRRLLKYALLNEGRIIQYRILDTNFERSYSPSLVLDRSGRPWIVWAGEDEQDEDIYFSRWNEAGWEPAKRVHYDNKQPDITPTIGLSVGGQPWVSWLTAVEKGYAAVTARWAGTHWITDKQKVSSDTLANKIIGSAGSSLPNLPGEAEDRLMGSIFKRGIGELQSFSERFINLQNGGGK